MLLEAPSGYEGIVREFGDPTKYAGNLAAWESQILGVAKLPYSLLFGNKRVQEIRCHKKLVSTVEDVFCDLLSLGLASKIQEFGGCYSFRAKRTAIKLSTHAWGIAIDINPATNQLGTCGDMCVEVVDVFKARGFMWGGDFIKTKDPMHFQFCKDY